MRCGASMHCFRRFSVVIVFCCHALQDASYTVNIDSNLQQGTEAASEQGGNSSNKADEPPKTGAKNTSLQGRAWVADQFITLKCHTLVSVLSAVCDINVALVG